MGFQHTRSSGGTRLAEGQYAPVGDLRTHPNSQGVTPPPTART